MARHHHLDCQPKTESGTPRPTMQADSLPAGWLTHVTMQKTGFLTCQNCEIKPWTFFFNLLLKPFKKQTESTV